MNQKTDKKDRLKRERVEDSLTKVLLILILLIILIIILIICGLILHTFPPAAHDEGGAALHHSPALYALLHEAGTVWGEPQGRASVQAGRGGGRGRGGEARSGPK